MKQRLADLLPEGAVLYDEFESCEVGVVMTQGREIACYSYGQVIAQLMQDMRYHEAVEYFEYNILGAHVGPYTPCFLVTFPDE